MHVKLRTRARSTLFTDRFALFSRSGGYLEYDPEYLDHDQLDDVDLKSYLDTLHIRARCFILHEILTGTTLKEIVDAIDLDPGPEHWQ